METINLEQELEAAQEKIIEQEADLQTVRKEFWRVKRALDVLVAAGHVPFNKVREALDIVAEFDENQAVKR